jgi:sugar (pentulose or hexulose) kinase
MKNQYFALLDIGGTDIKSCIYSADSNKILFLKRSKTPNLLKPTTVKREIDPNALLKEVYAHLTDIKISNIAVSGLLISGQMGGWITTNMANIPLSNIVSWQDLRSAASQDLLNIDPTFIQLNGGEFRPGLPILGLLSDYRGRKLASKIRFHTLTSFIGASLSRDYQYFIHETDIASSGIYNIYDESYFPKLIMELNASISWPQVCKSLTPIGYSDLLDCTVYTPVGDQQASLFGARLDKNSIVINIGTGGQVSKIYSGKKTKNQVRPYFFGEKIETITHLPAGRLINFIVEFATDQEINENNFIEFYNAQPIESKLSSLNLSDFEESVSLLRRDFSYPAHDLFPGITNAIIKYYLKTLDSFEMGEINKIVFVGGVGRNYKTLQKKIKDTHNLEIHVPILDESTLQGLAYLSSSVS